MRFISRYAGVAVVLSFAAILPLGAQSDGTRSFAEAADRYFEDTMAMLPALPGLVVVVVRADSVLYARGFGWADVDARTAITPSTPVYIASNTKAFTALAAALLAGRGVLDLDAPLTRYLRLAAFPAEVSAERVTPRHLLTHTSGLSNDPIIFRTANSGEHTPSDLHRLLGRTVLNEDAPLGSFGYTNTGYNIMGLVLEAVTRRDWQDVVRAEVFGPVGMRNTTARRSELPPGAAPAVPYRATGVAERTRIGPEKSDRTLHAAGGIISTAEDMGRWLRLQLGVGQIEGTRLLPADVVSAAHGLEVQSEGQVGPLGRDGYGLGWIVGSFAGERLVYHLGDFPGTASFMSFMPDHDLGVFVFANEDRLGMRAVLLSTAFVYDWLIGAEAARTSLDRFRADMVTRLEEAGPLDPPTIVPAEQARRVTGTFVSAAYGTLHVSHGADGTLRFTIGDMAAGAISLDGDTAMVPLRPARPEEWIFVGEDMNVQRVDYGEWGSFHRVVQPDNL